jgi:hypothetical protein
MRAMHRDSFASTPASEASEGIRYALTIPPEGGCVNHKNYVRNEGNPDMPDATGMRV